MQIEFEKLDWKKMIAPYTEPHIGRSLWQVINTLAPYAALWVVMVWSIDVSYWLTLLLAVPAAGLLVRAFIIFHDCCHGAFFKSNRANETIGVLLGFLTFTPFYRWRHDHAIHHATAGNLDKRGVGDVPTMTVREYLAAPWYVRAGYRILRNPFFLFTIGASFTFIISHRFPTSNNGKRERLSVIYTNLAILAMALFISWIIGWEKYVLVQLPIMVVAAAAGLWMFYVQHQFESAYWERQDEWDFVRAGLQGSSFYKLPAVLQWFTGNIGFHHIHHLSPRVPNYFLPKCHKNNPAFQIRPLTFFESLKCVRLHLWDEQAQRLVGFDVLRQYRKQSAME